MKQLSILLSVTLVILFIFNSCIEIPKDRDEKSITKKEMSKPSNKVFRKEMIAKQIKKTKEIKKTDLPPVRLVEILEIIDFEEEEILVEINNACDAEESISYNSSTNNRKKTLGFIKLPKQQKKPIEHNTEEYYANKENEFKEVTQNPLSTLSIDVDNASYSNIRRHINNSQLPPTGAVRIEEMINYFDYNYPDVKGKHPFNFITEISDCPWTKENRIVHVGIQGRRLDADTRKPSNLVFLIDASGSMNSNNKLPLLKKSFGLLLDQLDDRDKISIVVYAGSAGLVLPTTSASEKETIKAALNRLGAGGSTDGGAGILLAYRQAKEAFIQNGNNRIILATDGDFNVGISASSSLVELVEERGKDDIYLTILGLGMGNYKDSRMEDISNAGNGNYFYIDNIQEAEKVFVKEMRANLYTIAKNVKIQIEFNPAIVKSYRLIGYENRLLAKEDFNDDKKDAGELGAGHTVTALYEVALAESSFKTRKVNKLKYQKRRIIKNTRNDEIMTLMFRYMPLNENKSILIEHPIINKKVNLVDASDNFRFSTSVAGFGMLLRDSKFRGELNYKMIEELAKSAKGNDKNGYRKEYISLVKKAKLLSNSL